MLVIDGDMPESGEGREKTMTVEGSEMKYTTQEKGWRYAMYHGKPSPG
jgi:hypothetical protein